MTSTMTPVQQLAQSRQAITAYLHGDKGQDTGSHEFNTGDSGDRPRRGRQSRGGAPGWVAFTRHAVRTWWRHHPAYAVTRIAQPVLQDYASEKPLQLVGIAAGLGAAVVVLKPWRLVSLGAVLAAAVRSQDFSAVLGSVLAQGLAPAFHNDNDSEAPTP